MKKLLSVVFLLSLVVSFISVVPSISAIQIPEGAVIKTDHNPDVYIVKYKNGKQFKRLVLNPQVFESYGHLRWEDILKVDQSIMNSFVSSNLVRVDGQADIYQLIANGDIGSKHYLECLNNFDLDSVYTINDVDFNNYVIGEVKGKTTVAEEEQTEEENIEEITEDEKQEILSPSEPKQSSAPKNTSLTPSIPTPPPPLTEIQQFYSEVLNLPTGECGTQLKSGTLPNGVFYRANVGCYHYKDDIMERFTQLNIFGKYYPLNILLKYEIKATEENKTRIKLLSGCEFMNKSWSSEIKHHIEITQDSIYYKPFENEGLPIPQIQVMDFHPSYQRYCEMDDSQQQEYANKLDELSNKYSKFSFTIAILIWGWQDYL